MIIVEAKTFYGCEENVKFDLPSLLSHYASCTFSLPYAEFEPMSCQSDLDVLRLSAPRDPLEHAFSISLP